MAFVPRGLALASESEQKSQIEFFERRVRPLLAERCFECHSAETEIPQGKLELDTRAGLLQGGSRGPSIVPGKPEESLLVEAVRWRSLEMPPGGRLEEREIADLVKWVEMGAPWPGIRQALDSQARGKGYDWPALRKGHWAWRPIQKPVPPDLPDTSRILNPIDRFVQSRLATAGLQPVPPAELHVLVRRVYLDLVGFPPLPQQVDEFVEAAQGNRQAAIERVVGELLDSPHYGERWGRYWLDVARYSDGFGGFLDNRNGELSQAWRYRDWVVEALNRDLPYDRFIKLQISGDLIDEGLDVFATGFFALGPSYHSDGGDADSVAQAEGETLDDRIDTLTRGLMAITVSCARCHDHKFDPIPQRDYYSLAGVFKNTEVGELPLAPDDVVKVYQDHQQKIKDVEKKGSDLRKGAKDEGRELTDQEEQQQKQWKEQVEELKKASPPKYDFAHVLAEAGSEDMPVAIRGDLRKPGEVAPRRFLRIVTGADPPPFVKGSGRLELADAVANPENPLTARVIVNRIWMHHFGKALVRSPSNFGTLGMKPTHPEMLDWLAVTFIESGWSIKSLHRLIMTSDTYQMSTRFQSGAFRADGDNELLWRMNPRRMDVESWRDSLLTVTAELDSERGGPPVEELTKSKRRTLYAKVSRLGSEFESDEFLRLFDFPSMRATVSKRPSSIVPQQFLFLMNSPFMVERAKAFSERLHREAENDRERISRAYRLLFSRSPSEEELQMGTQFLSGSSSTAELSPWQQYGQVLMCSNEFMYVR